MILPAVTHPDTGQTVRPRYEYEYDDQGNQTLIRDNVVQLTDGTVLYDHDGNTGDDTRETTFTYDDFGRQTSRTLPEGESESYQYDEYGRQILHVDFAGRVTEYVFDDSSAGLGRLDEKRFFDNLTQYDDGNGTPAETVEYTYDDLGRVLSIVDDRGTTSYTYNNDGRTTKIDSPEGIIRYEYEPLTNRLTRTYTTDSAGEVLNDFEYTYDGLGRLKTVTVVERNDEELATPETTTYSYDLVGNLGRVDQPNGIVTDYEYDDLNRLDKLTHYEPDATPEDLSDNDKIAEFDYDVRADGRRTAVTETYYDSGSPETIEIDWTYDNLGRLVDEVFNHYDDLLDQTLEFSYDLVGNRLEQTKDEGNDSSVDEKITYTYDDNDRLLTESKDSDNDGNVDQTTTYSYTAAEQTAKTVVDESTGNTTSQTDFTYNLQGRLESVTIKTYDSSENLIREEVTTYEYDDKGYRVTALHEIDSDADGTFDTRTLTEYLADPNNHTGYTQTIEETVTDADTGAEIKKIVSSIGHDVIAQTTFTPSGPSEGDTIVLLYDGHGSTRLVADLAAQILEAYAYDAYGNAIGFDPGAALTSLLYSGEAFDTRINQQYLRARWYDATTGRFNRLDPFAGNLRDPQSLHKYLYTHGDPVNGTDPTGLFTLISTLGATTGAAWGEMWWALGSGLAILGTIQAGGKPGFAARAAGLALISNGQVDAGLALYNLGTRIVGVTFAVIEAIDTTFSLSQVGGLFLLGGLAVVRNVPHIADDLIGTAHTLSRKGASSIKWIKGLKKSGSAGTAIYDVFRVPGPNPNNLRYEIVDTPTTRAGVYLKPHNGKTKVGSSGNFRARYRQRNPQGGAPIEVEIVQTKDSKPAGVDDSAYPWDAEHQRYFDEEYVDRVTPPAVRYRARRAVRPVSQENWDNYRHIFGYGDVPSDFGL